MFRSAERAAVTIILGIVAFLAVKILIGPMITESFSGLTLNPAEIVEQQMRDAGVGDPAGR